MEHSPRQFLRFPPDEGAVAWIDPEVREEKIEFKPTLAALVVDEALVGCGLVTIGRDWLAEGRKIMVRVENLAPLRGEIRWVRDLGLGVVRLGVVFLE